MQEAKVNMRMKWRAGLLVGIELKSVRFVLPITYLGKKDFLLSIKNWDAQSHFK